MSKQTGMPVDDLTDEEQELYNTPVDEIKTEDIPRLTDDDLKTPDELAEEGDDEEVREEKPNRGMVPQGAMHAEREKRKGAEAQRDEAAKERDELRQKMQELQENFARGDERTQMLLDAIQRQEAMRQQQPQVAASPQEQAIEKSVEDELGPEPDKLKEPFAFMDWQNKKIALTEQRLEQLYNRIDSREKTEEQKQYEENRFQELAQAFGQDANALMEFQDDEGNQPYADFAYAYQYLVNSRDNELQLLGYADPNQRAQIMKQEETQIMEYSFGNRQSPSVLMYQMALQRGYQFDPAWVQGAPEEGAQPAQSQQTETAMDKINRRKKAQESNKSLDGGTGNQGIPELTPEYLASLSEDEFNRLIEKMPEDQVRLYFGG